ncbi:CYFA0S01e14312g1_1 [Cyberlindnera fabianii]|uniref:amidase n=1 Tax=Cyberlindnera fabianii TaxID=36022 RepID=A0A061AJ93_CYBFA|nr:CYFA0S01e14312g1_1 [Cyberlindnera fabianii]
MSYKEISARKKAERDAKFNPEWLVPEDKLPGPEIKDVHLWPVSSGYLSASEIEITSTNPLVILSNIASKKWTAVEVYRAFAHRATIAHQLTNCLTEVFFDEGLKTAQELDEYYATTGKLKGPLHGLPVSLKDNQPVKGIATSMGYTSLADSIPTSDGLIVSTIRDMGAVFYVKTNLPTAMMMLESQNFLWGTTMNPFNRDLTCGGSSGGEGCLVAMRGSAMGLGGDLGGSLRCPGGFQNLYTIKTTSGRWPIWGGRSILSGCESVPSVNGPIATCVELLELYGREIAKLDLEYKDPKMLGIKWDEQAEVKEKLCFAVCYDDGVVHPTPPVQRGIKTVVEKLKAAGHEVIEWDPTGLHEPMQKLVREFYSSGGTTKIVDLANETGEPIENPFMKIVCETPEISTKELWVKQTERILLHEKFLKQWLETSKKTSTGGKVDGIISPLAPLPAAAHGTMAYIGYTSVWNGLDWPTATVPVTRADKDLDVVETAYTPRANEFDEQVYKGYDPELYHGGPVAIQITGPKMRDEKVLKMVKVISKAVGTDNYWFE